MLLFGVYRLPAVLGVSAGCLGRRLPIKLAGQRGRLTLPRLEWVKDRPELFSPPADAAIEDRISRLAEVAQGAGEWGKVGSWHRERRTIGTAFVFTVLLEFRPRRELVTYVESVPDGELVKALFNGIDRWFDDLRTWVELAVNQDMDPEHPLPTGSVPGHGLALFTLRDDRVLSSPRWPSFMTVVSREVQPLTQRRLSRIVPLANRQSRPSEARLLLRDARAALFRGQTRRCAIDAGSAVEVGLAEFNRKVTKVKLGRRPTLGIYVKQPAIKAAAGLPSNTERALVQLRNDAIHQNATPVQADAYEALQVARLILDRIEPLPI